MPLPKEHTTVEDIYNLPEGQRAELIDGQIHYMAPPSRSHQRIAGKLYTSISNYIDAKAGPCEPYIAPFAVFLNENDKNYVEPDISVICDPNKLTDRGCNGAPDWIIEIVSPAAGAWTTPPNCLNTALPVFGNTGLSTRTKTELPSGTLQWTIQQNTLLQIQ